MSDLKQRLEAKGWTHAEAGELTDAFLASRELLVIRGLTIDTIFTDTPENKRVLARHREWLKRKGK